MSTKALLASTMHLTRTFQVYDTHTTSGKTRHTPTRKLATSLCACVPGLTAGKFGLRAREINRYRIFTASLEVQVLPLTKTGLRKISNMRIVAAVSGRTSCPVLDLFSSAPAAAACSASSSSVRCFIFWYVSCLPLLWSRVADGTVGTA